MTAIDHAHVASPEEVDTFWTDGYDINLQPVTATACHALHCDCRELSGEQLIAGYRCCKACLHTIQSHQPGKTGTKVRR